MHGGIGCKLFAYFRFRSLKYHSALGYCHVLVYSETSHHVLVYRGTSHQCWYIIYHPKIRAGALCTIPGHVLVYSGPKFGPKTSLEAVMPGEWSDAAWHSDELAQNWVPQQVDSVAQALGRQSTDWRSQDLAPASLGCNGS